MLTTRTKRKWIITGGAGFIGCHAAARFHRAGHHVVVVDNLSRRGAECNLAPSYADWRPSDQRVFVADIGKARRLLGCEPTVSTAEGVDRLLAWVRAHRDLFPR